VIRDFGQISSHLDAAAPDDPPDSGRQVCREHPVDPRFQFREPIRGWIKDRREMFPQDVGQGRLQQRLGGLFKRRAAQRGIANQFSGHLISDFAPAQAERPMPENEVEQQATDLLPKGGAGNFHLTLIHRRISFQ
jgi:hypothetical protein